MTTDTTISEALAEHLRRCADQYFPHLENRPAQVRIVGTSHRSTARLYRFQISANGHDHFVLAKKHLPNDNESRGAEKANQLAKRRPRLGPCIREDMKSQMEFAALSAIHDYFTALDDPRFNSIRPLDVLSAQETVLMEDVRYPDLRRLFLRCNRLQQPFASQRVYQVLRRVGAWLRRFHALPMHGDVEASHQERGEFIESINRFSKYLGEIEENEGGFAAIAERTVAGAKQMMPEVLPLGLAHGDFALRNVLVCPEGRVWVIDTLAKCRMPIYRDLAYFLVELRMNRPQVYSQGLIFSHAFLTGCEQAFLTGYFADDPVPVRVVRLFEIQALLNKWGAILADPVKGLAKRTRGALNLRRALVRRAFRKETARLLRAVECV